MPKARKLQIALDVTAYDHVISRCVCCSFLCGEDQYTGKRTATGSVNSCAPKATNFFNLL